MLNYHKNVYVYFRPLKDSLIATLGHRDDRLVCPGL